MKNLAPSSGSSRRRRGKAERRTMSKKKKSSQEWRLKKKGNLDRLGFSNQPVLPRRQKTLGKMSF